ncbi:flavin reductase family protein [Egicoccus halophilus]|uniref:Oxidoreductase n=1 Tax=Egicoccus halophilus TaxID=1670830 RepID=A0A8J3ET72_9ACTN|nr:flavin reductase family protein [Egicoccus halophilus]GGI08923.1 oxidoreductase [Egicoccus halophilus]
MADPQPPLTPPRRDAVDPGNEFRTVLGRFATGVSVMTTVVDAVPHGMTANAVSSVSLEPKLVLVCVERGAVMAERVRDAAAFALTFLAADQAALSAWFADPGRPDTDQFADVGHTTAVTGAPVLDGGVGWVDCRLAAVHVAGDHDIVVGEVVDLGVGPAGDPLLYYASDYRRLQG